jgi:hypothetical protein
MKKLINLSLALLLTAGFCGLTSCSDDNNGGGSSAELTAKQTLMKNIAAQYLEKTVDLTYSKLALTADTLYNKLYAAKVAFQHNPSAVSQSDIDDICGVFIRARSLYETSEAFLFGAASDFGIDPHIDTWPLDLNGLVTELKNTAKVNAMDGNGDADAAISYAAGKLGQELLGFHGIEFIIFRDGKNRAVSSLLSNDSYTKNGKDVFAGSTVTGEEELIFATAVAGDLRDRCWQMEVSWNENAPSAHKSRLADLGLPYTVNGGFYSYGQNMLNACNSGSTYASWEEVMTTILKAGCENIADEVANTKIGNPYSGEDPNYIESPYSERSFYDFEDNITSIENSLYGGRSESRNESLSIMSFLQKYNPDMHDDLESKLKAAVTALNDCRTLNGGFVNNYQNAKVGVAQNAINALDTELTKVSNWFALQ